MTCSKVVGIVGATGATDNAHAKQKTRWRMDALAGKVQKFSLLISTYYYIDTFVLVKGYKHHIYIMAHSILSQLNNDLDEIHAYFQALDCWKVDEDSNSESWKTPSDQKGHHTFRILKTPLEYKIVGCSPSHSAEVGADYDINNHGGAGKSFSNCVMALENIDAKELARRYADKYGDKKPSSLTVRQTQARAKPKPEKDYQFPYKIRLDEESLCIEYIKPDLPGVVKQGERLIQDDRMPNVYIGKLTGTDTEGNALIEHFAFRYDTADGSPASLTYRVKSQGKDKGFWQYSFNSDGTFTVGSVKKKRLFNEQSVQDAHSVFYVEGEKKAYDLQRFLLEHGINGVGVVTSGSSDEFNAGIIREVLGGKSVFVFPDNDAPGYKHAGDVWRVLQPTGSAVRVWKWSDDTKEKDDISDFLAEYSERLQVDDLPSFSQSIETLGAGSWTDGTFLSDYEKKEDNAEADTPPKKRLKTITAKELAHKELPPKKTLLSPWLREGSLTMVNAKTGIGKSWFALAVAKAVSEGSSMFDGIWEAPEANRVLYIDGEMENLDIQERLNILKIENDNFILHTVEDPDGNNDVQQVDVGDLEWQQAILDEMKEKEIQLLILDNVVTLYHVKDKSTTQEYWEVMQTFIIKLRALGYAVLLVDHEGKDKENKTAMGTAAKAFVLNFTFTLSQPDDYQDEDGARFVVEMGKKRNKGEKPFIVALQDDGTWAREGCLSSKDKAQIKFEQEQEKDDFVRELFRNGEKPAQIWNDRSIDHAKLPTKKKIEELYDSEMSGILREMLNSETDPQPLPELLERFEPAVVRKAYLLNNPHRQGDACVDLLDAGQAPDAIIKTFRELNGKDADEPEPFVKELVRREREKDVELYKEYILLLYQGKDKDYFDKFKKFQKFTYTKVRQDLTRSHFTEKNAELIPMTLQQADAPLCLVWLPIEEHKGYSPCVPNFDEAEMCRIYIGVGATDKERKRRLEALRGIRQEEAWRKRISNLAKEFKIELDKRKPGVKSGKTA